MIAYLKGKLTHKSPADVIIEVGGVGYAVHISLNTYSKIEALEEATLLTYLHFSIGQSGTVYGLYGFADEAERMMFLHLIDVSGVGVNTARLMLSAATPMEISTAIVGENLLFFKKIKGIGEKTAKLIILTLKDKVLKTGLPVSDEPSPLLADNKIREEALQALVALGYLKPAAQKVLNQILKQDNPPQTVEQLIKAALRVLS